MQMTLRSGNGDLGRWACCALALAVVWVASGCASTSSGRPFQIEMEPEGGFTVTERVDTNASVRRDFDQALELIQAGDHEAGIALLEEVVEATPDATVGHLDLGIAYALTGNFENAQLSLETAVALNPKHPVVHNELGIVHRKQGHFEDARRSYESALDVYPDFHHARRNLAILCDVYLSDMKCARKNYELYRELMPDDEAVSMWLADLQNRMGD